MLAELVAVALYVTNPTGPTVVIPQTPEQPQTEQQCLGPDAVQHVYQDKQFKVMRLAGPELESFNAAFSLEYRQPAPDDDVVLLIERGDTTAVFSFKDGCMIGSGKTSTENIRRLLTGMSK